MNKISISLSIIYLLIIGISCRTEVNQDFPNFEKKTVLNSIIIADSIIQAHVSLTDTFGGDSAIASLTNAQVLLFKNSICIDTLQYKSNSIYTSKYTAEIGATYTYKINILGFEQMQAMQLLPKNPRIISTKYIQHAGKDEEGNISAVDVSFAVNPNIPQYFEILLTVWDGDNPVNIGKINSSDSVYLAEGIPINIFSNNIIRSDSIYTMRIEYSTSHIWTQKYIVKLRALSKDLYIYKRQEYLYMQGRYPEFSFSAIIPSQLYSNVQGGYGIFAGYSETLTDTIPVINNSIGY